VRVEEVAPGAGERLVHLTAFPLRVGLCERRGAREMRCGAPWRTASSALARRSGGRLASAPLACCSCPEICRLCLPHAAIRAR
jgi:hypothetical protein